MAAAVCSRYSTIWAVATVATMVAGLAAGVVVAVAVAAVAAAAAENGRRLLGLMACLDRNLMSCVAIEAAR